jgi:hypothetical protein
MLRRADVLAALDTPELEAWEQDEVERLKGTLVERLHAAERTLRTIRSQCDDDDSDFVDLIDRLDLPQPELEIDAAEFEEARRDPKVKALLDDADRYAESLRKQGRLPELGEDCERAEPTPQEEKDWACLGEAAALLEDAMRGANIPLKDGARCVCALQNLATRSDCTGKHPDPPELEEHRRRLQAEFDALPDPPPVPPLYCGAEADTPQVSDAAVEVLARRLYEEHRVERPAALPWSAAIGSVRKMYRQDACAHLDAIRPHLRPEGEQELRERLQYAIEDVADEQRREPATKWWLSLWDRLFPGETFPALNKNTEEGSDRG